MRRLPWWLRNALWTVFYDWRPSQIRWRRKVRAINSALELVTAWNREHPDRPVKLRLRLFAGVKEPEWVERL